MNNYRFFTTADVITTTHDSVIEIEKMKRTVLASDTSEEGKALYNSIVDVNSWLPQASKVYNISGNINDYVVVKVCIMLSDLPNRNGVAFPLRELVKFNPDMGCLGYQTWKGKPCHQEHKNDIIANAKGVIFDSVLKPASEFQGDLYKVILLAGFDRKKDSKLYNDIVNGTNNAYSMGAYSGDFQCSVCGALHSKGGCKHASQFNPEFKKYDDTISFLNATDIVGFELSAVKTPAYVMAINNEVTEMSKL